MQHQSHLCRGGDLFRKPTLLRLVLTLTGVDPGLGNDVFTVVKNITSVPLCPQVLNEHLKALQAASQTWQRTMTYASRG